MSGAKLRAYLAGPCVFKVNALEIAAEKKRICAEFGIEGVFPLDCELDLTGFPIQDAGRAIYKANIGLIRSCQLVFANMERFRGPGMDGGTAYEVGFADALGIPIYGYNWDLKTYDDAVIGKTEKDGNLYDENGLIVERFGYPDNLMMSCAYRMYGSDFRDIVRVAADHFGRSS